jgi:hypothetical protein
MFISMLSHMKKKMEKKRLDMTPSGTWQDLMAYNGFKPYECPVCHKTFNSPSALEHHLAYGETDAPRVSKK